MKGNYLKYLGRLGLFGLIGIVFSDLPIYSFIGFFGFFGFFAFGNIKSDERLSVNINKAARNVFISSLILSVMVLILGALTNNLNVFQYGFMIHFIQLILVFTGSFRYYDTKKLE